MTPMRTRPGRIAVTIAITLVGLATSASAQQTQTPRPERPYRGMFGGDVGETEELLEVTGSTGIGWDLGNVLVLTDQNLAEPGGQGPYTLTNDSTKYGLFDAGVSYALVKRRLGVSTSAATVGQYRPGFNPSLYNAYSAYAGATYQLSRSARLRGELSVSIQPFNFLPLGPTITDAELGEAVVTDQIFRVSPGKNISRTGNLNFNRKLGRRSSLDVRYETTYYNSVNNTSNLTTRTGGARYSTTLTKGLGIHAGYAYTRAHVDMDASATRYGEHNIDAGIDLSRDLGPSRRTHLTFSTGAAALSANSRTRYYATADALLTREIGRSWSASLAFRRGVDFDEQFREAFLTDSLTVGFGGLITRRLQLHSSASAILGHVGFGPGDNTYRSYNAGAGLTTALNRRMAISADYLYYSYGFGQQVLLPNNLFSQMGRHGVRVSLTAWVPVIAKRRSDASR